MSLLTWQQNNKIYTTPILDYTAVLREQSGYTFTAHIEDHNELVLREWHDDPIEFEEAERWAIFCAVDLEQSESKDKAQRGMLQTLDLCQPILSVDTPPSYLQRLKYIREWILHQTTHDGEMVHLTRPSTKYLLNWSEQDNNHYQAMTSHGKAWIVEERAAKSPYLINPANRYMARIEHVSGATYKSPEIFMDFVDAEHWLQRTLAELDDPRIAKYYLGNIHFTLSICKRNLPSDAEPFHVARLEYLEMIINDALL
jgi:hypothetical protein